MVPALEMKDPESVIRSCRKRRPRKSRVIRTSHVPAMELRKRKGKACEKTHRSSGPLIKKTGGSANALTLVSVVLVAHAFGAAADKLSGSDIFQWPGTQLQGMGCLRHSDCMVTSQPQICKRSVLCSENGHE